MGDAGVNSQMASVGQSLAAAGEAAEAVVVFFGSQDDRKIFPVEKIGAFRMCPVHRTPFVVIWVILVEHVIFAAVEGESVRIVHPAAAGG
ncbi:MAG: hypothetical protein II613_01355 [Bacteroidales bacterium]|nr:hypothetical protein [Bacteroidales bacterium]